MSTIDDKELKESLGFGLIFAIVIAAVDYLSNEKNPQSCLSAKTE